MKKKVILSIFIAIALAATSFVIFYYFKTQRQALPKKAAGEFKSISFILKDSKNASNLCEGSFAYKWESLKFIWKFEGLSCTPGWVLVHRRILHVGVTEEEVIREGWIDRLDGIWTPGDPLPANLDGVDATNKGCWYQLDLQLSIKPQNTGTDQEDGQFEKSDRDEIPDCGNLPSPTPTVTINLTPTPTPTEGVTPTPTGTPVPGESGCDYLSADKTSGNLPLSVTFKGKGSDTNKLKGYRFTFGDGENKELLGSFLSSHVQEVSHTYTKSGTFQVVLEILDNGDHWKTRNECKLTITTTGQPSPTPSRTTEGPTPTEIVLPEAGLKIPTMGGLVFGFLLISLGIAFVF